MKFNTLFLLTLFLGLFSCTNTPPTEEELAAAKMDSIKVLIMDSHDTTMAQMNYMGKLRNELNALKADTTQTDTLAISERYRALMDAQQGMMHWMEQFENTDEMLVDDAAKLQYLQSELEKMDSLEDYTFQSIQQAEALLKR